MKKIALFLMLILAPLHLWAQDETLADIQGKAEAGDGAALLRLSKVYADGELALMKNLAENISLCQPVVDAREPLNIAGNST